MKVCIHCGKNYKIEMFKIVKSGNRGNVCDLCRNEKRRNGRREKSKQHQLQKQLEKELEPKLPIGFKVCNICDEILPLESFGVNNTTKDKLHHYCKSCMSEYRKKKVEENSNKEFPHIETKVCAKCNIEKYTKEFNKSKSSKDGFYYICKECGSEKGKVIRKKYKQKIKIAPTSKVCKICGELKTIEEFAINHVRKDGYDTFCKICKNTMEREKYKNKVFTKEEKLKKTIKGSIHDRFRRSIHKKNAECVSYGIDFDYIFSIVGPRPSNDFQLDHIIPLALFDYSKEEQIYLSQHPGNLRWITELENNTKNDFIIWDLIKDNPFLFYVASNVLGLNEEHDGKQARDIKLELDIDDLDDSYNDNQDNNDNEEEVEE